MVSLPISIVGGSSSGRSALWRRWTQGQYDDGYRGYGAVTSDLAVETKQGRVFIPLTDYCWELEPRSWKGAKALIIVFSVTNPKSLDRAMSYVQSCDLPFVVVGTMTDLPLDQWRISRDDLVTFVQEHRTLWYPVSAKTGQGMSAAILALLQKVYRRPDLALAHPESVYDPLGMSPRQQRILILDRIIEECQEERDELLAAENEINSTPSSG